MMEYREFDSFEDIQEEMAQREAAANASLTDEQRNVTFGDYWTRPIPEYGIFEFGKVLTWEEFEALASDDDDVPAGDQWEAVEEAMERGYCFSRAFSTMEPEGMLGDTHKANLWPISEEDFKEAQVTGWMVSFALATRVFHELERARAREHKHTSTRKVREDNGS